jgi:hypothetical protein
MCVCNTTKLVNLVPIGDYGSDDEDEDDIAETPRKPIGKSRLAIYRTYLHKYYHGVVVHLPMSIL